MADNNKPDVPGLVSDPAFLQLSMGDKRAALSRLTGDNTFASLSDADTTQFIARMSATNFQSSQRNDSNATISAGSGPFWERVQNDLRYGGTSTPIGRAAKAIGVQPFGEKSDNPITQTLLGPAKVGQGIAETPKHPIMGPVHAVGGLLDTANIPLAFAANAPGVAEKVFGATIPPVAKEQAAQKFSQVMSAAGNQPVNIAEAGNIALRSQELAQSGGSMPKVIRDFLRRASDPEKGPITYAEARDFYSNATRLSADEFNRLTPVMKAQVGKFTNALGRGIYGAAESVGQGEQYARAMSQYRFGAQGTKVMKSAVKYGTAAIVGDYLARALLNRFGP